MRLLLIGGDMLLIGGVFNFKRYAYTVRHFFHIAFYASWMVLGASEDPRTKSVPARPDGPRLTQS